MQQFRLREAYGLAGKALYPGSERKVFVFYFLGVPLADDMLFFGDKGGIAFPVVGVVCPDIEGFQIGQKFLAYGLGSLPQDKRQHAACRGVDGAPQPALVLLAADVAPLLVGLYFPWAINDMPYLDGEFTGADIRVYGNHLAGLFFSVEITVFLPIPRTRAVSLTPLPFTAMSTACSLTPGS